MSIESRRNDSGDIKGSFKADTVLFMFVCAYGGGLWVVWCIYVGEDIVDFVIRLHLGRATTARLLTGLVFPVSCHACHIIEANTFIRFHDPSLHRALL